MTYLSDPIKLRDIRYQRNQTDRLQGNEEKESDLEKTAHDKVRKRQLMEEEGNILARKVIELSDTLNVSIGNLSGRKI